MQEPMMHTLRKRLFNIKGIILINSALFVEMGLCNFVNNNLISIECPIEIRLKRLKNRGYTEKQIENRLNAQKTVREKIDKIQDNIYKNGCGTLIRIENKDHDDSQIVQAFDQLSDYYKNKWNNF